MSKETKQKERKGEAGSGVPEKTAGNTSEVGLLESKRLSVMKGLLFSDYIEKYKINPYSLLEKSARISYIHGWMKEVAKNFNKGKEDKAYQSLANGFIGWLNKFLLQEWDKDNLTKKIDKIDQVIKYAYQQLFNYIVLKSQVFPMPPTLPYPYEARHSGVSMCAYLAREEKGEISVQPGIMLEACDALQTKARKGASLKEMQSEIAANITSSVLSDRAKKLVQSRLGQFHAEDYWFSVQLKKLLDFFDKNKDLLNLSSAQNDNLWLLQLDTYPRLEFVMSSSACEDCKQFFTELRLILNEAKIYLPIIIYANNPFNTAEIYASPIVLIKYDGSYLITGLAAKMPYYVKFQSQMLNRSLDLRLFGQEQMTFSQLESIANQAMPTIIAGSDASRYDFVTSMFELFYGDGTVNWNTSCWMDSFLQRLPDNFILEWQNLNKKVPDEKAREDFASLVKAYGPLETPQDRVNQALSEEIKRVLRNPTRRSVSSLDLSNEVSSARQSPTSSPSVPSGLGLSPDTAVSINSEIKRVGIQPFLAGNDLLDDEDAQLDDEYAQMIAIGKKQRGWTIDLIGADYYIAKEEAAFMQTAAVAVAMTGGQEVGNFLPSPVETKRAEVKLASGLATLPSRQDVSDTPTSIPRLPRAASLPSFFQGVGDSYAAVVATPLMPLVPAAPGSSIATSISLVSGAAERIAFFQAASSQSVLTEKDGISSRKEMGHDDAGGAGLKKREGKHH